jgi:hypothetical protein
VLLSTKKVRCVAVDAKANVYLADNVTDDVKRVRNVTVTKRSVASLKRLLAQAIPAGIKMPANVDFTQQPPCLRRITDVFEKVGELTGLRGTLRECVDASGDVWIVQDTSGGQGVATPLSTRTAARRCLLK